MKKAEYLDGFFEECKGFRSVLNFRMYVDSQLEHWRADTAATKEPETLAWIADMKGPGIMWDVGANVGLYSLYAATLHPDLVVYAFEPELSNFIRLCQNVRLNNLGNVHPMHLAFSDTAQLDTFYVARDETGNSGGQISVPVSEDGLYDPVRRERVMAVTGRHLVAYGFTAPDWVKVDVDGAEGRVIMGMNGMLHGLHGLLIELSGTNAQREWVRSKILPYLTDDNAYNRHEQHSRIRRAAEGVNVENMVFMRR